jgi:hypothetical protein
MEESFEDTPTISLTPEQQASEAAAARRNLNLEPGATDAEVAAARQASEAAAARRNTARS